MGRYQAYPEYKDSGLQWLGEIPSNWQIIYSKAVFSERNEKAQLDDEQLTASQKYGILPQKLFMEMEQQKVVQVLKGHEILKKVEVDDFVISMRSFQGGIEYSPYSGSISSAYVPLFAKKNISKSFFKYFLKSAPYIQALQSTTNLVRDGQALRYGNFIQVPLPVFDFYEQENIGKFLDHETAKIDTLIEKQQQLIQLLKEKRQAVISHAVTKGLNPNAPMKDSGVEWLGEVPEHWDVKKIAHLAVLKSGESIVSEQIEPEGIYPVFGGNGLRGFTSSFTHDGSHVLIGRQGALCGNINYASGKFWASEHAVVVYPMKPMNIDWLGELLRSMNLNQYNVSAAQPGLAVSNIVCLKVPFPCLEEQEEIANHIGEESKKIERLVEKAEDAILLMQERRTALISAVVTGKIDVRGWQAPQN